MADRAFGEETVQKVAALARLQLSSDEVRRFSDQLGNILGYIDKLGELDTSGVEPMTHALELDTPLREDEARPSPGARVMLDCAPEELYESYKVPQVMGGGDSK